MNKEWAAELFKVCSEQIPNLAFKVGNETFTFARANMKDVEIIEGYTDDKLLEVFDSYLYAIASCHSIRDMQILTLLEYEINSRGKEMMEKATKISEEFMAWEKAGGWEREFREHSEWSEK